MAGAPTYRQRDLAAAMRAAIQSGFPVKEIYIDRDGKIVIVADRAGYATATATAEPENEWDEEPEKI